MATGFVYSGGFNNVVATKFRLIFRCSDAKEIRVADCIILRQSERLERLMQLLQ